MNNSLLNKKTYSKSDIVVVCGATDMTRDAWAQLYEPLLAAAVAGGARVYLGTGSGCDAYTAEYMLAKKATDWLVFVPQDKRHTAEEHLKKYPCNVVPGDYEARDTIMCRAANCIIARYPQCAGAASGTGANIITVTSGGLVSGYEIVHQLRKAGMEFRSEEQAKFRAAEFEHAAQQQNGANDDEQSTARNSTQQHANRIKIKN